MKYKIPTLHFQPEFDFVKDPVLMSTTYCSILSSQGNLTPHDKRGAERELPSSKLAQHRPT